jgi:hypothetical protein
MGEDGTEAMVRLNADAAAKIAALLTRAVGQ